MSKQLQTTISLLWSNSISAIIECHSGATITTQADGCCCSHPSTRGFVVPMPATHGGHVFLSKAAGFNLFCPKNNYLKFDLEKSKGEYENFLLLNGFVDAKIISGVESWINFTFKDKFSVGTGILTWPNSD